MPSLEERCWESLDAPSPAAAPGSPVRLREAFPYLAGYLSGARDVAPDLADQLEEDLAAYAILLDRDGTWWAGRQILADLRHGPEGGAAPLPAGPPKLPLPRLPKRGKAPADRWAAVPAPLHPHDELFCRVDRPDLLGKGRMLAAKWAESGEGCLADLEKIARELAP